MSTSYERQCVSSLTFEHPLWTQQCARCYEHEAHGRWNILTDTPSQDTSVWGEVGKGAGGQTKAMEMVMNDPLKWKKEVNNQHIKQILSLSTTNPSIMNPSQSITNHLQLISTPRLAENTTMAKTLCPRVLPRAACRVWFYSPTGKQTFMAESAAFQKPCAGWKPFWGAFLICNYEEMLFFSFLFSVNILLSNPLLCLVAQSCPVLCDPLDYSPPGSSVHGISQARILKWAAISSSRGSIPHLLCLLHCRQILYSLSHHGSPC